MSAVADRLGELARLRRKYGDDEDQVLDYLERSRSRAEELGSQSDSIEDLERATTRLREEATASARRLTKAREEAAPKLQKDVEALLADLAMPGSRFVVTVAGTELYEGGHRIPFIARWPGKVPAGKASAGGSCRRGHLHPAGDGVVLGWSLPRRHPPE